MTIFPGFSSIFELRSGATATIKADASAASTDGDDVQSTVTIQTFVPTTLRVHFDVTEDGYGDTVDSTGGATTSAPFADLMSELWVGYCGAQTDIIFSVTIDSVSQNDDYVGNIPDPGAPASVWGFEVDPSTGTVRLITCPVC